MWLCLLVQSKCITGGSPTTPLVELKEDCFPHHLLFIRSITIRFPILKEIFKILSSSNSSPSMCLTILGLVEALYRLYRLDLLEFQNRGCTKQSKSFFYKFFYDIAYKDQLVVFSCTFMHYLFKTCKKETIYHSLINRRFSHSLMLADLKCSLFSVVFSLCLFIFKYYFLIIYF